MSDAIDWEVEAWDRGWRSGYDKGFEAGSEYSENETFVDRMNRPALVAWVIAGLAIAALAVTFGVYAGLRNQVERACDTTMNSISASTAWLPACQSVHR